MAKFGIALALGARDFAGSNPVIPTTFPPEPCGFGGFFLFSLFTAAQILTGKQVTATDFSVAVIKIYCSINQLTRLYSPDKYAVGTAK